MRASEFFAAPAFVTSPRRNASMNTRASSSFSPSLSLLPTSWSPSSLPVRNTLRSAPFELGSTDGPREVDGVDEGILVPYAWASRPDLNLDWAGLGRGPASVASRGTSCLGTSVNSVLRQARNGDNVYLSFPIIFAADVMRVRRHGASSISTDGIALLEIGESNLALVLQGVKVEFIL